MKVHVTPIVHPANILRNNWHLELPQERYLQRIVRNPFPEVPDVSEPPPDSILYPTLEQMEEFLVEVQSLAAPAVSIDLENVGDWIICAGCTALDLGDFHIGTSICIRFRIRGGNLYWNSRSDMERTVRCLGTLLADPDISMVWHNGIGHDVPILERLGFSVRGRHIDTMGLQHTCFMEQPKGLQFCSTLYLGVGVWKTLVSEDDESEGKG